MVRRRIIIGVFLLVIVAVPVILVCTLFPPTWRAEAQQEAHASTCYHILVADGTTTSGAAMTFEHMSHLSHHVADQAFEAFRTTIGVAPDGGLPATELVACPSSDGQHVDIRIADLQGS
jgi:hypothetical protein